MPEVVALASGLKMKLIANSVYPKTCRPLVEKYEHQSTRKQIQLQPKILSLRYPK